MTILDVFQNDGFVFQKKASTNGGEFKGPCPWCGGKDRVTIWPSMDRFICRQCKQNGDSLAYCMEKKGMGYRQACTFLGIAPEFKSRKTPLLNAWQPRECKIPSLTWQNEATRFLFGAFKRMLGPLGKDSLKLLESRGIGRSAVKKYRLGYVAKDTYFDREKWGLLPEINTNTGKPKRIWIPAGIVIPVFDDAKKSVVRLRVRRNADTADKYIVISGSSMEFMRFGYNPKNPSMIIEAELDSILCDSLSGDRVNFYGLGNVSVRPDIKSALRIESTDILYCLDNDAAGEVEFKWWEGQYPKTKKAFAPSGKDPGEFFEAGGDIGKWIDSLLIKGDKPVVVNFDSVDKPTVKKSTPPTPPDETAKREEVKPQEWTLDKRCYGIKHCNYMTWVKDEDIDLMVRRCHLQKGNTGLVRDMPCPKKNWNFPLFR